MKGAELIAENARLKEEVKRYEDNIKSCLDHQPDAIRVCEGGGPEDLCASLAATMHDQRLNWSCLALHAELMANAIENAIGMIDFTDTQVLKLNEVLKSYRESAASNRK